jgi:tetratricopeptide (TPR) repeat protein
MPVSTSKSHLFLLTALGLAAGVAAFAQTAARQTSPSPLQEAAKEIAAGKLDQAETSLQLALTASPGDARALDLLGVVRVLERQDSAAEELFARAVKAEPGFAPAHAHLGLLYLQLNRPQDALPELRLALRLDSGRTDAAAALVHILRLQAQGESEKGDWDGALNALLEARKDAPSDAEVAYEFGIVAMRLSLIDDAIGAFQQTLTLRKDDVLALYNLGYALMERARFEDARQQFVRYVALRPQDPLGYCALGMTLAALERTDEARAQFERSIALDAAQSEAYYRLGLLDLNAGSYDAAEQDLRHALEHKPNDAAILTALGRVKFEQKHYPEALSLLQQAVGSDDSLREAHYYLGLTLARLGRNQESDEQLETAARLEQEEKERSRNVLRIREPESEAPPQ